MNFRSAKTNLIVGGLVSLLIALILGGLWVTNAFGWRGFRLVDVEAFVGAELPAGAQDVHFVTENEKSRIIWLRFIPSAGADLTAFLDTVGLADALREGFTPFPNTNYKETSIEWWIPQTAQTFVGVHAIRDNKVYEVLIDQSEGSSQTVYVRVYGL